MRRDRTRKPRTPVVTLILFTCVIRYFQQMAGVEDDPVHTVTLGALLPGETLPLQPWRLLTASLLHASPRHLVFNLVAIFVFARGVERTLGSRRMFVLWTTSVVGSSLLSQSLGTYDYAVGASGGIYGVFAAHVWIAWKGPALLPEGQLRSVRIAAVWNLGAMVYAAFQAEPHVDQLGHLGGFLSAAVILSLGWLTPPRAGEGEADATGAPLERAHAQTRRLRIVGDAMAGLWLLSLASVYVIDRPHALHDPPEYETTWFLRVDVDVPRGIRGAETWVGASELEAGSLLRDPAQVRVVVTLRDETEPAASAARVLRADLAQLVGGDESRVAVSTHDAGVDLSVWGPIDGGRRWQRLALAVRGRTSTLIVVTGWAAFTPAWHDVADTMARSVHERR